MWTNLEDVNFELLRLSFVVLDARSSSFVEHDERHGDLSAVYIRYTNDASFFHVWMSPNM